MVTKERYFSSSPLELHIWELSIKSNYTGLASSLTLVNTLPARKPAEDDKWRNWEIKASKGRYGNKVSLQ